MHFSIKKQVFVLSYVEKYGARKLVWQNWPPSTVHILTCIYVCWKKVRYLSTDTHKNCVTGRLHIYTSPMISTKSCTRGGAFFIRVLWGRTVACALSPSNQLCQNSKMSLIPAVLFHLQLDLFTCNVPIEHSTSILTFESGPVSEI